MDLLGFMMEVDISYYDDDDPETMHKNIAEIISEAAQRVTRNPPKYGSKKWVSDATLMLVVKRDTVTRSYHQRKSAGTKEKWKDLAKQVQTSYLEDERPFMEKQVADQQGASRKTWKIMNDISGKLAPCLVGKVKKLNGEIIKSPQKASK